MNTLGVVVSLGRKTIGMFVTVRMLIFFRKGGTSILFLKWIPSNNTDICSRD